ncbi:hypothetical protein HQ32_03167 [Prauserella sp. Am3]|nr:hypothetical protein HQ32_03167 [Prauserella sp. Am3]
MAEPATAIATTHAAGGAPTPALPDEPDAAATATAEHVRDRLLRGAQLAALIVAVTIQLTNCLPQLITNRDRFGHWWMEVAGFLALASVAAVMATSLLRHRAWSNRLALVLAGVCIAASVVASVPVPGRLLLVADDWSFGIAGWYILALLFRNRLPVIGGVLALHAAATVAEIALKGMPERYIAAQMGMAAVSVFGFQIAVALLAELLRRTADAAGEAAEREERSRTDEEIAQLTHRDHQERYARLLDTTVPLLTGLAYGTLDPADDAVRRRSAIEAARMRQLFAETDDVSDRLLHELRAGIDVAERQGVSVQLAVRGEVRDVPHPARRELVDLAATVLASARTTARATVVRTRAAVRVSVVADAPPEVAAAIERTHRTYTEVTTTTKNRKLWAEAVWLTRSP